MGINCNKVARRTEIDEGEFSTERARAAAVVTDP